jgi:hypothetical protein
VLQQLRVGDRIEPADVERRQAGGRGDAEPEVDQRRRERALVLMRERADGREDRETEEREADRPGVGERQLGQLLGGVAGNRRTVGLRRQRVVRRRLVGAGGRIRRLARGSGVRGDGRRVGHDGLRRLGGLGDLHRDRGPHAYRLPVAIRIQTFE